MEMPITSVTPDLVLAGGNTYIPSGAAIADVAVRDGKIICIGHFPMAGMRIDCKVLDILPGVIDSQVHFREPGLERTEDLETGSKAVLLGSITAVFEKPNTMPIKTSKIKNTK